VTPLLHWEWSLRHRLGTGLGTTPELSQSTEPMRPLFTGQCHITLVTSEPEQRLPEHAGHRLPGAIYSNCRSCTISATSQRGDSNTLPFRVRAGRIYLRGKYRKQCQSGTFAFLRHDCGVKGLLTTPGDIGYVENNTPGGSTSMCPTRCRWRDLPRSRRHDWAPMALIGLSRRDLQIGSTNGTHTLTTVAYRHLRRRDRAQLLVTSKFVIRAGETWF